MPSGPKSKSGKDDRLDGEMEDLAENAEDHGEPDGEDAVEDYADKEDSYSREPKDDKG